MNVDSAMTGRGRGLLGTVELGDVLPAVAGVPRDAGRSAPGVVLGLNRGEQVTVGGVHSPAGTLDCEVQFVRLATVDHETSMTPLSSRCKLTSRVSRDTVIRSRI